MNICIHKGAKQIGGSCVELEAEGKRLILDIGLPLDAQLEDTPLPAVTGLEMADKSLLGIVISHAHQDHYGLLAKVLEGVPIIIGRDAAKIINAASDFFPGTPKIEPAHELKNREPIVLGPFTITPFLMDHSAYDAYAIMVEAAGRKVFYTGDFRGHGRKGRLFEKFLENPPKGVDVLLMEGSTLGRTGIDNKYPGEVELEERFVEHFKSANGLTLVWTSSQNIDRLVTIYRACRKANKKFIADIYTANILRAIGNERLPQKGFKDFLVFVPFFLKKQIKKQEAFSIPRYFSSCRVFEEDLAGMAKDCVMLFRPSMARDLTDANCLTDATLIYSLWPGYLADEKIKWFGSWLKNNDVNMVHCHTSGHAHLADLKRMAEAISPKKLVPIHSFEPDTYQEHFDNVEIHHDGEAWEIPTHTPAGEGTQTMKNMTNDDIITYLQGKGLNPIAKREVSRLMISSKVIRCKDKDVLVAGMGSEHSKDDQIHLFVDAVHMNLQPEYKKDRLELYLGRRENQAGLENTFAILTEGLEIPLKIDIFFDQEKIITQLNDYGERSRKWITKLEEKFAIPIPDLCKEIEKQVNDDFFRWYRNVAGSFWSGRVGGAGSLQD